MTDTPTPTDRPAVIQADRDAAADMEDATRGKTCAWTLDMRAGKWDDSPSVEAFARHRLATEARLSPAATGEGVREPLGALLICDQTGGRMWTCWPVPHLKKQHADSIYGDTGGYRTVPLYALPLPVAKDGEQHPDDAAVDRFAVQMKAKLAHARDKGRGGWDDPAQCTTAHLNRLLLEHVEKGDPVDVANFCMMLSHYGARIAFDPAVRSRVKCNRPGCDWSDGRALPLPVAKDGE